MNLTNGAVFDLAVVLPAFLSVVVVWVRRERKLDRDEGR